MAVGALLEQAVGALEESGIRVRAAGFMACE
jgi:hypothetical protein